MADIYRPISFTSICCKLFAKFVQKHLMGHFNEEGLITNAKHGFRSERSLNLHFLKVIDDFTRAIDKHEARDILGLQESLRFGTTKKTDRSS